MKRTASLLAAVLVLLAGAGSAQALSEWTLVLYMCLDDDKSATLEDSAIRDIQELDAVGSQPGFEILVQADRGPKLSPLMQQTYSEPNYSGAMRYAIQKGKWVQEGKLGEVNMGSPKTLWDCLKWAATAHPAKHYFVVLAGHGSGVFSWRGTGNVSSATPGAVEFDPDKFVAYDSTDNDCLTVFEVGAVLKAFKDRLNGGRKVDVIGFDSCLASMIEVVYQLKDTVDVVLGSASTVPMTGFNYGAIARAVAQNPAVGAEALADVTCKGYIEQAACQGRGDILGAWRTSKVEEVAGAVSRLSIELLRAMQESRKGFALKNLVTYSDANRYWDLKRAAESFVNGDFDVNGASNRVAIQDAAKELIEARVACKVSMWYGGGYADQKAGGLSVAWPDKKEYGEWRAFYKALDFARDTKWDEVLDCRELGLTGN